MRHSEETIASVAKFAEDGLSGSQIAALLGNMTRNAVIALASRNQIHLRGDSARRETHPRVISVVVTVPLIECEPVPEPPRDDLISFEDLTPTSCRYPFGDHDYKFCGRKKLEDRSYCKFHCQICFAPR